MSTELELISVFRQPGSSVRFDESGTAGTFALRISAGGELEAEQVALAEGHGQRRYALRGVIGLLRKQAERGELAWFLSAKSAAVSVNGVAPVLPLVQLAPGDVISVGDQAWFATRRWTATPAPAPESLAQRPCPICGLELGRAPVIQCPCGRWMHLERPDRPDDQEALNCYLVSKTCGGCQRSTTLEPLLIPELPESLRHAD